MAVNINRGGDRTATPRAPAPPMRRQGSVERLDAYRRRKGTRKLYLPLRVPQWEEPPRTNSSPSHAAVLFDIAYAAALSRHASILVSKSAQSMEKHVPGAIGFYLATGPALIWQWWQISAFLCRFDSGDLLNEFLLVLYMILVVGQSFSIEPCAGCVFSRNMEHPAQSTLPSLSCDADINGDTNSAWPAVPAHCRMYVCFAVASRLIHFLDTVRALCTVQRRARREVILLLLELAIQLPLWLAAASVGEMDSLVHVWAGK